MFRRQCNPRNSLIIGLLTLATFIGIGMVAAA